MSVIDHLIPSAQAAVDSAAFARVIDPVIENIVDPLVMLVFAVAIVVFVYGVFQMVWSDADDARKRGRMSVLGGLIGMFIMLSAWGIIHIIADTISELAR